MAYFNIFMISFDLLQFTKTISSNYLTWDEDFDWLVFFQIVLTKDIMDMLKYAKKNYIYFCYRLWNFGLESLRAYLEWPTQYIG